MTRKHRDGLVHFRAKPTREPIYSNVYALLTVHVVSSKKQIPSLLNKFRAIFCCDEKSHSGHMKAVTQSVLDGTSKWSAKIAITGLHCQVIKSVKVKVSLNVLSV